MHPSPASTPSQIFIHELRNALNHLYDPDYLRSSPLAAFFGVSGRFDTPSALQNLLTRAIESLKPGPGVPNKLYAQATYDLLLYRYVQQFNQHEIANQLGISVRHLRRQQNLAIYELANRLWEQHNLGVEAAYTTGAESETAELTSPDHQQAELPAVPDQFLKELTWLTQPSSQTVTDLSYALDAARLLVQPFAEQKQASLVFPSQPAGLVQVHPVAFQQILLGLLSFAIQHARAKEIRVDIGGCQGWLALTVSAPTGKVIPSPEEDERFSLETVRKMVSLSEGRSSRSI